METGEEGIRRCASHARELARVDRIDSECTIGKA